MMNLKGRDYLTLLDFTKEEIEHVLNLSLQLKKEPREILKNKTLIMLFQKPSTRTRISFEVAMTQLGGHAIYMDFVTSQLSRGESLSDTAKVLSRYGDVIMARLYRHEDIELIAKSSEVPVINGLTDLYHPCQTTGDLLTVLEKKGKIDGLTIAFVGDCGFNMANSTMIGFSKMGANVRLVAPEDPVYLPKPEILEKAKKQAKGKIEIFHDPVEGVKGVDIIYTDVWVSMGQEEEKEKRLKDLKPFQVNSELVSHASPDVIVMHCLPAHRGQEITSNVMDGPHSVIWDQAENRLHAQKGILAAIVGGL
ncbi:MAG: ornithine carbamoyltransferase [Candidatus Aenigmarchaeota archaeon]|nr:ornithine carbamoyltransferase [Candidatus Aenigmarchaeota archaeon]